MIAHHGCSPGRIERGCLAIVRNAYALLYIRKDLWAHSLRFIADHDAARAGCMQVVALCKSAYDGLLLNKKGRYNASFLYLFGLRINWVG